MHAGQIVLDRLSQGQQFVLFTLPAAAPLTLFMFELLRCRISLLLKLNACRVDFLRLLFAIPAQFLVVFQTLAGQFFTLLCQLALAFGLYGCGFLSDPLLLRFELTASPHDLVARHLLFVSQFDQLAITFFNDRAIAFVAPSAFVIWLLRQIVSPGSVRDAELLLQLIERCLATGQSSLPLMESFGPVGEFAGLLLQVPGFLRMVLVPSCRFVAQLAEHPFLDFTQSVLRDLDFCVQGITQRRHRPTLIVRSPKLVGVNLQPFACCSFC
jgi:hypothetical protein